MLVFFTKQYCKVNYWTLHIFDRQQLSATEEKGKHLCDLNYKKSCGDKEKINDPVLGSGMISAEFG